LLESRQFVRCADFVAQEMRADQRCISGFGIWAESIAHYRSSASDPADIVGWIGPFPELATPPIMWTPRTKASVGPMPTLTSSTAVVAGISRQQSPLRPSAGCPLPVARGRPDVATLALSVTTELDGPKRWRPAFGARAYVPSFAGCLSTSRAILGHEWSLLP
jgi:hypothetical protein